MKQSAKPMVRWEEDELILVCQFLQEVGWQRLSLSNKGVTELSNVLRTMRSVGADSKVRSPSSVILKAWDLYSFHPDYVGAAHQGTKMDQAVLHIFLFDPAKGAKKAAAIRAAHAAG